MYKIELEDQIYFELLNVVKGTELEKHIKKAHKINFMRTKEGQKIKREIENLEGYKVNKLEPLSSDNSKYFFNNNGQSFIWDSRIKKLV